MVSNTRTVKVTKEPVQYQTPRGAIQTPNLSEVRQGDDDVLGDYEDLKKKSRNNHVCVYTPQPSILWSY